MEQECYAFIHALDKWHTYLSGTKFIWETDHKALTQLNQKAQLNKRCERWRLRILEYEFKVKYIPGTMNAMPDYLSRAPVDSADEDADEITSTSSKATQTEFEHLGQHSNIIVAVQTRSAKLSNTASDDVIDTRRSVLDFPLISQDKNQADTLNEENRIIPFTVERLRETQKNDVHTKTIINNLKEHKQYVLKDDLLMRRSHPPVPYVPHGELRRPILKIYHDIAANGAHFGRDKTIHKIKTRYFWLSMYKDINNHIKSCIPCAQHNPRWQKTPGTLRPNKPPEGVWQLVFMNFHGPISPSS